MPIITGPGRNSSGGLVVTTDFNLVGFASVIIPAGRKVRAVTVDHADFANMRFQISFDGGTTWEDCLIEGAGAWITAQNRWVPCTGVEIKSDGTSIRIHNGGAGAVNNIQYAYEEIN